MKNKIIKSLLTGTVIVSLMVNSSVSFAKNNDSKPVVSDKDKVVSMLLNAGWDMQQINDLPDSELLTYKDGKIVGGNKKFYRVTSQKKEVEVKDKKTGKKHKSFQAIEGTRKVTELTEEQCMAEVDAYKKSVKNTDGTDELSTMSNTNGDIKLTAMGRYDNGYDFRKDSDGWLQMDITATYISGTKYKLSTNWKWLTEPRYTQIDVVGLGHDGGLSQTNDAPYCSYSYEWYIYHPESPTTVTSTSPIQIKCESGGTVVSWDLGDRWSTVTGDTSHTVNHRGYLSYYANVTRSDLRYVSVYGQYEHQQEFWGGLTPSIAWPLSIGFSVTNIGAHDILSPNPYFSIHVNY